MERSRKTLLKIASTSNKVVAAANDYADRKDSLDVQLSHFQLEEEMQKISVACECLGGIIGKMPLQDGPAVDERLKDWLQTSEPQICFDTLDQMEKLLQEDTFSRMPATSMGSRGSAATKDKIHEAVSLLESRKGYFHFLFSTETWNNERGVQRQQVVPESREHIAQAGSNVLEQSLPVPVQTNINTTVPDAAIHQGGHVVTPTHARVVDTQEINKQDARKLKEISNWLDSLNCAEKQDTTLSLCQPDTCKWLFDTTQYRMWRSGDSSFLWLHGKPGAGKSVLASSVIESLEKSRCRGEILVFFYCDFRNERSASAAEAMRSILSQLLRQLHGSAVDLGSLIGDLVKAKDRGGATRNNTKELTGFASRAAGLLNQNPLVVVDALDECKDVEALLEGLVALKEYARLFVTSRPLPVIKDGLFGLPFVSMDDMAEELSAAIELHVTRELDARRRLRQLDVGFKNEIRSVVCCKADGMFRWVQCSIETLNRCVTRREVQMALDSLPDGLHETYERILLAIDTRVREGQLARRALIWLVAALRPLRLNELLEGLSIDLQTQTLNFDFGPMHSGALLDACGSLVTYTEKTGIIILSHFSVKEYLMGKLMLTKLPQYHIDWERAHLHLARSCMCYLSMCLKLAEGSGSSSGTPTYASSGGEASPNRRVHPESHPLRDYVLDNALHHFQHLGQQFGSILHDIKVLDRDIQQHTRQWDNMCLSAKEPTHSTTPSWPTSVHNLNLYILVAFAPDSLLRVFLRLTALKPKEGTNPLVYAAHFNKDEHARTLLSRGAELNRKGWETRRYHQVLPIEVALKHRHYAVVTLFVAEGSTVPPHIFTDSFFRPAGVQIPSSIAKILLQTDDFAEAANDPANKSIVQLPETFNNFLWELDTDEQDFIAIIRRFTQVVDANFARKSDREAFLRSAIEGGRCSTARHLLALGIPLLPEIFVSLNRFGRWGKAPMIRFLVENGANVLVCASNGDTVLHILLDIVSDDDEDILRSTRLLVAHGCDPLRPNIYGQTPLHVAVDRGLVSVAHYLLSTFYIGTPLSHDLLLRAAQPHFHRKKRDTRLMMLHLLVKNGVPLMHTTKENTLLHHVLRSFEDYAVLEVTKFLVGHGCDPLRPNLEGKTPLHIAVEQGFVSVVRYFLSEIQVGTPLPPDLVLLITWCIKRRPAWNKCDRRLSMLCLLVENGANVRGTTIMGESVLHVVLKSFDDGDETFKATKLLVAHGCDPHEVDHFRHTPLHVAIRRRLVPVARYLLSLGIPLPPDPLLVALNLDNHWKPRMGDAAFMMVLFLIESGANACACTRTGDSMLHIVLQSFDEESGDHTSMLEIARLLVSHGCDPLQTDSSGKTPLRIAIERGHVSVSRYLLSVGAFPGLSPEPLDMFSWSHTAPMICFLVENAVDASAHTAAGDSMLHVVLEWGMMTERYALEATKVLVTRGCDPLEANSIGETPLHITFRRRFVSVAQYLLSLGVPSSPGLLLVALEARLKDGEKASLVHYMVEHGTDVPVCTLTASGHSLLHIALQSFHEEDYTMKTAKLLVAHGCDPLGTNPNGQTPLHITLDRGHVSVARYLLSLGVSPTPDLLRIALGPGSLSADKRVSLVRCLVDNGADVHMRTSAGDSVLHIALQLFGGDYALETAKFLVGYGCDTQRANSTEQTPLHIAVERGHISVTRYLLRACGVRPSPDLLLVVLNSELAAHERASIFCCLVENGASVDVRTGTGDSMLHAILQSFSEECWILEAARLLVSYGCHDPHEANSRGEAPLRIAVERGYVSVAKYLLSLGAPLPGDALFMVLDSTQCLWKLQMINLLIDQGASVLDRASNGDTVLHRAVASLRYHEVLEGVTLLVDRGCHFAIPNARGATPLHIAVEQGRTIVVKHLLSLNVPLPSDIIFTAIQDGSIFGWTRRPISLQTIEALVTSGCDTCIRNASGLTPLDVAMVDGHVAVVDYLLSVVDIPSSEQLLSAIASAPPNVQDDMSLILSNRLRAVSRSESPELPPAMSRAESPEIPPAKRTRHS